MSSCACRRWGPGTTCEKPVDTPSARELDAKMKALMAEREKQGNFWLGEKDDRQCDLNNRSNAVQYIKPVKETPTSSISSPQQEQLPAQQLRFWN